MASDNSNKRADATYSLLDCSIGELLRTAAADVPDRLALISPENAAGSPQRSWTYRELLAHAGKVARALLAKFGPGARVATWASGSPEMLMIHFGAALAGIVLVTLNPANRAKELEFLLVQSRVRGLILDRWYRKMDNAAVIESLGAGIPGLDSLVYTDDWPAFLRDTSDAELPTVPGDSPALILFTSGTTGKPKAAILRHSGVINNARLTASCLELREGRVWLNLLPLFHIGGSATISLGCIANRGTQVLLSEFSAEAMIAAIQEYRCNLTMAVPTMMLGVLASEKLAGADLSSLEIIVMGGTTVTPDLVLEVRKRVGAEVMVLFGQTEAGGAMCMTRRGDGIERVTESVGGPLPLSRIKVVSATSRSEVAAGVIGEICVSSPWQMSGYFDMPEKTREVLDTEGWLHTGDLGFVRDDGYVQVTGRLKDMIIRGGENIYPREIEDTLAEHPAVLQSAVFGVPDAKWGEQVAAAIVLRPGHARNPDALAAFLLSRIARHKLPKHWRFVDAMPVNASGKIQKFILRENFQVEYP